MKHAQDAYDSSDDEVCSYNSKQEGLECPICHESFNIVENVPYVLWCGHSLCKSCILGCHWAVMKFPPLPVQLPLFMSCPWCNLLSFRIVYRGNLKFPRKNFFLLWIVESMNGDRVGPRTASHEDVSSASFPSSSNGSLASQGVDCTRGQAAHHHESPGPGLVLNHNSAPRDYDLIMERLLSSLQKSLVFFVHLTSKFPLVVIFVLILVYVVPATSTILALYMLITVLFAFPSVLMLCFAYPSLAWLISEIFT